MGRLRQILGLLALLTLSTGGLATWYLERETPADLYRTVPMQRADIVATIRATGTVVPEDVVDVGAQINGQIAAFGQDQDGKPVDYRSTVAAGAVLAKIDDSLYAADVATAEAQLAEAQAQVRVAESDRDQAQAKLDQAQRDWGRAQELALSPALARVDYDAARSTFEQARAGLALAQAAIEEGQAAVTAATPSAQRARRNLAYCTIRSPVLRRRERGGRDR